MSPYAVSKYANELYADVFSRCYGIETIGLRYFNVFGPRQGPAGAYASVIPLWIQAMSQKEPVFINGDGKTTRDFCYVEDVVQANLLAALTNNVDAVNNVYNVAVGEQVTLNKLFEIMLSTLNILETYKASYRDFRIGDIRHSVADINKAKRLLKYNPVYTLQDGLQLTMSWYKGCFKREIN